MDPGHMGHPDRGPAPRRPGALRPESSGSGLRHIESEAEYDLVLVEDFRIGVVRPAPEITPCDLRRSGNPPAPSSGSGHVTLGTEDTADPGTGPIPVQEPSSPGSSVRVTSRRFGHWELPRNGSTYWSVRHSGRPIRGAWPGQGFPRSGSYRPAGIALDAQVQVDPFRPSRARSGPTTRGPNRQTRA